MRCGPCRKRKSSELCLSIHVWETRTGCGGHKRGLGIARNLAIPAAWPPPRTEVGKGHDLASQGLAFCCLTWTDGFAP